MSTESIATNLEILVHAKPRLFKKKIYVDYNKRKHANRGFIHKFHPLEEALANAYAYEELSEILKKADPSQKETIEAFQQVIKNEWVKQSQGYRNAGDCIGRNFTPHFEDLLRQIFEASGLCGDPLIKFLAKVPFPFYDLAIRNKSVIPTFVLGTDGQITEFFNLISDSTSEVFKNDHVKYIRGVYPEKLL